MAASSAARRGPPPTTPVLTRSGGTGPAWYYRGPTSAAWSPEALRAVLRCRVVGADVGAASGLKCCFASLQKGYTALAIQSYTTAERLGVLGELRAHMGEFAPATGDAGGTGAD